jgi:hypothetical protein
LAASGSYRQYSHAPSRYPSTTGAIASVAAVKVPLKIASAMACRSIAIEIPCRTRLSSKRGSYVGKPT